MATGAYDANGIWQYGEDDNIALFSDLLKLGTSSTSAAFTADRARLSTLEAGSLAGIIPVKPTTITVASGTAAVNAVGLVTFTTATSISLSGVFSPLFKNYRMMVNITASTNTSTAIRARFLTGATEASTAYFGGGSYNRYDGAAGTTAVNNETSVFMTWLTSNGPTDTNVSSDIYAPYVLQKTSITNVSHGNSGTGSAWLSNGQVHDTATSFDGIKLYPAAGNFSGTVIVYGYND